MTHPGALWHPDPARLHEAATYSAHHRGLSFLVLHEGRTVAEDYPGGGDPHQAHHIASGTKSLTGLLAATAAADGLIDLDEPVAAAITEWQGHPRKGRVTVRQLLQLVGGIEAGGKPGQVPTFEQALHARAVADPGHTFLYGAAAFQVFGEMLRRRTAALCEDPLVFLEARVFDRIGARFRRWRRGADHFPDLSSGAVLTARDWARLGEWVRVGGVWEGREVVTRRALDECFRASAHHPVYGLGWWLNAPVPVTERARLRQLHMGLEDLSDSRTIPPDLVYSAGAGKQRLYVSRERRLVVVRQAAGILEALAGGDHGGFSDRVFLEMLFG